MLFAAFPHALGYEFPRCGKHFTIFRRGGGITRDKDHVITLPRTAQIVADRPHPALRGIPPDRIAQFFTRNKSNTTLLVVLSFLLHKQNYGRCSKALSICEYVRNLCAGLDSLQHDSLFRRKGAYGPWHDEKPVLHDRPW